MRRLEPLAQMLEHTQESALRGDRLDRLRAKVIDRAHVEWQEQEMERGGAVASLGHGPAARWMNLVVSAAVGACLAIVTVLLWPERPLTFRVAGQSDGSPAVGTWIESGREEEVPVWFSDGTVLGMEKGARMKVAAVAARGAEVVVAEGSVHVAVTHRPRARWTLRVGPFDVRVTGTRFSVGWAPNEGEFTLVLDEGSVVVSGGCLERERVLTKGDQLRTRCGAASSEVSSENDPEHAPAHLAPSAPLPRPPAPTAAEAPSGPRADSGLVLVAPSEARTAQQLLDLADQARLAGDQKRARAALLKVRRAFPESSQAAVAAFDLGVIEFDTVGDPAAAAEWFQRYLREVPTGPLRREAMGRLIEATLRTHDEPRARRAARDYLRDYPSGPHAGLAQGLVP